MSDSTVNVPAVVTAALRAQGIDPSKVNLMLPTQTYGDVLGMFNKVTFESITINPDVHGGEVYEPNGKGKGKALGKVPLQKIAFALGIKWDPVTTGTVEDSQEKCRAKATGAIQKPNGDWLPITDEKTIDVEALTERDCLKLEEKVEKGNPDKVAKWGKTKDGASYPEAFQPWKDDAERERWIDRQRRTIRNQFQLKRNELANTGAHERVIRAFIAMKSTYSDGELSMPFVYPCVSLDASKMLATPELQAAALRGLDSSVRSIFGGGREMIDVTPKPRQLDSQPMPRTVNEQSSEVLPQQEPVDNFELTADPEPEKVTESTPLETSRVLVESYREKVKHSKGATAHLETILAKKNPVATLDELNSAIDKYERMLQKDAEGRAS